jgi:hypothetical protein
MKRRIVRKLLIVIGVIVVAYVSWKTVLDRSSQPVCHKQIDSLFHEWQAKHKTREFPNVRGESQASLSDMPQFKDYAELKSHYSYVPGLTRDDPGDLVLMYVNSPTRWTWHGQTPTVFTPKVWILVPVDMKFYGIRDRDKLSPGEFSERVPFDEFRMRLEKTLKYLEDEKRPNWETAVKEHSEFLKTAVGVLK